MGLPASVPTLITDASSDPPLPLRATIFIQTDAYTIAEKAVAYEQALVSDCQVEVAEWRMGLFFLHSHAAEELVPFGYKLISKADCCALDTKP